MPKCCLFQWIFFLGRTDYALEENVLTVQIWFLPIISYWEVVTRIFISCRYCFWSAYDSPSAAWLFFLTPFEMLSSSLRLNKGFRFSLISPKCLLELNNYKRFCFCPWMWRFLQISKNGLKLKHQHSSYINFGELRCYPVMIALKAMNFKLELIFLRIMWVFGHFFTCGPTCSQLQTFSLIGVNVIR